MASILIADDETVSRQTLAAIVEQEGHTVHQAGNGREALELIARQPVDVLMTDIFMPEKEGLQTIKELKRSHPGIRIIAFSGGSTFSNFEALNWAGSLGAQETLKKPFQREEILDALRRVLRP